MKNNKLILPLLVMTATGFTGCLTSCKKGKTLTNSPIIISEYVNGSDMTNSAIELANISDKDVDLSQYHLNVYYSETSEDNFDLEGTLKPGETYIVINKNANDADLLAKANQKENIMYSGTQPISLYKGKKLMDIVGTYQNGTIDYGSKVTLTRKKEFLVARNTYDEYDWIRYLVDTHDYLGTLDVSVTNDELLEGPQLTEENFSDSFFKDGVTNTGGGGVYEVTLKYGVDGDTSVFNYPSEFTTIMNKVNPNFTGKVRYQGIDTPESYTGNIQEFGIPAKLFTTNLLENAKKIYVQSIKNGNITESFNRLLGWVWADGKLVNLQIVLKGYSDTAFSDVDTMIYKGVTYSNYLHNASLYAQKNKLGKWGEKDPYWDYDTWSSTYDGTVQKPSDYDDN